MIGAFGVNLHILISFSHFFCLPTCLYTCHAPIPLCMYVFSILFTNEGKMYLKHVVERVYPLF
uniref:Uncharacterized protein n=1 Tax=Octopus bimaculoides TaxID=37653 RepID=A0A0L8GYX1_OCTBM